MPSISNYLSFLGEKEQFLANSRLGVMQIVCPPQADFTDENLQNWLRKVIEESLRRNAKSILPPRLEHLSAQCGLPYASVKINSSQGRWGSCSARKNINLSYYLVLLPSHLIDYVLLHELCHTREMNTVSVSGTCWTGSQMARPLLCVKN